MNNKDILVNSMAGYPLTLYIDRMADNINSHKEDNVVLNHLRYSMYQEILNAVGEHTLSFEALQQQVVEWKQIKTIKDIILLLPNADTDRLTKEDLKCVKQVIKELDQAVTLVKKQLQGVCDKCLTLADKHEKPQERQEE
jgi:hypothetical protein|nr:MAG TPA: hypothetical protein [Caudoviricetes sp.]